jgi:hypothetical protein
LVVGEDVDDYSGAWGTLNLQNVTLTVTCNNRHTISGNKSIFSVSGTNKLIINGKLTLMGTGNGNQPIVSVVTGGTFELDGEAVLMGSSIGRQGVYVMGGTFIMKSGSVCNNFHPYSGAGVHVMRGIKGETGEVFVGTFIMEGGKIFGNTASSSSSDGGGVGIRDDGVFIMKGGAVYGNKARNGGGVAIYQSAGSFIMEGGTILGSSDGFINGEAVPKNEAVSGASFYRPSGVGLAQYGDGTIFPFTVSNVTLIGRK